MDNIKETSKKVKLEQIKEEEERIFQAKMNTYTLYNEIMKKLTKELYVPISTQVKQYTDKGFDNILLHYDLNLIKRYLNEIKWDKNNIKLLRIFEKIVNEHDNDNDPNKKDFESIHYHLEGPLKSFFINMICDSENEGEKYQKLLFEWFKHMTYPHSDYLKEHNYQHLKGLGINIINEYKETKLIVNLAW